MLIFTNYEQLAIRLKNRPLMILIRYVRLKIGPANPDLATVAEKPASGDSDSVCATDNPSSADPD